MLRIHFANRIETLTASFVDRVAAAAGSAFAEDAVIVPSAAVRRYLTLAVARRHGICANLRFDYLARWLWQQIGRIVPGVADESPFDSAVLAWRIDAAFGDAGWTDAHPRLQSYLDRADEVMRHELAARVAGLLDQYTSYRPDWLAAWSQGQPVALDAADAETRADQAWQAALWRRLVAELGAENRHPAAEFVAALDAGVAPGRLPAAAHVFCLPDMPPLHLRLLQALGRHVDIHLHALNPCREYWFDVVDRRRLAYLAVRGAGYHEEGHRLLAGWGRQAQSQLALLVDAGGDTAVDDAQFVEHPGRSLLARLQNSILDLADLAPGSVPLGRDDRSIEIHVCHAAIREVEVLHDRLLALFAAAADGDRLTPGDILVVVPDLEATAPLVDAVFGTVPADRHIPYAITGRARSRENPAARALLDLLALLGSRFAVSGVFGLLQQPWVARRFGLGADELEQARRWLQSAGVHWALDAAHRGSYGLPAEQRYTLSDGLDRLFLGYALPQQVNAPFDGRLPAGDAEGSRALALGGLWRFVDALSVLRHETAQLRPAPLWPVLLADALQTFVDAPGHAAEDLREVHAALQSLGDLWWRAGFEQPLPLDVVRLALAKQLDGAAAGGVPTGKVTFAAMGSLRGLPFRVVCAIGLNDGAFPSSARPAEFDLIALQPRLGDRQRRIDERNLFLDLLLAARERVHLGYVGRSVRDNAVLPPSVLVSELLEYLVPAVADAPQDAAALARARARLVVEHPLQPFAEPAFRVDGDERLRSFQRDYAEALQARLSPPSARPAAAAPLATEPIAAQLATPEDADDTDDDEAAVEPAAPFFAAPLPELADEARDLPLQRLERFFRNPCRELLVRRLGLTLRRDEDEWQDDEPFLADVPARLTLARRLLPLLLQGADAATIGELARAGPEMPAGAFGRLALDRELASLQDFAARLVDALREPCVAPHAVALDLEVDGRRWRLHAAFADLRSGGLVRYSVDELRPADRLGAWLHHLMLCADPPAGIEPVTTWWGRDGPLRFKPCPDPRAVLHTLVALYAQGLREPIPFMPKTAWAYLDKGESLSAAIQAWRPTEKRPWAEGADPAYRLALRGRPDPLGPGLGPFDACAHAVFDPLRDAIE